MGRKKLKPDMDNLGENPFIETLKIKVRKKIYEVKNKFGDDDVIDISLEAVRFTKLFEQDGAKELIHGLSPRGKELFLWIVYGLEAGRDAIWVDRIRYMEKMKISAQNTYRGAVLELSEKRLIYPHVKYTDVFFINPHWFFKGDRVRKYGNNIYFQDKQIKT